VLAKVRAPIDKALDWLVNWIVTAAKKLFAKAFGKDDKDTPASKKLKKEVGESLQGKRINSVEEEQNLANSTYAKFAPKGLKSLRFQRKGNALSVLVSASAEELVAKIDLGKPGDQAKLITLMRQFRYLSPGTYIYTHYQGERIHKVSNFPGHAEQKFAYQSIPIIQKRLLTDLKKGKLTPTSTVPLTMFMTRTPCAGCAQYHIPTALATLKSDPLLANMNIQLNIEAAAMTQGRPGEVGLQKLIDMPNVDVKPSDFWAIVKAMLAAHPQFYNEVTTRHWLQSELNDFMQASTDLKVEIDAEVARKKKEPKDIKKG